MGTVLLLLTQFYLTGMRMVTQQFRNAMGIFLVDRYRPLVEVVLNLVISLAAVRNMVLRDFNGNRVKPASDSCMDGAVYAV